MNDYTSIIDGMFGAGPLTQVNSTINDNPDDAARAMELSRASGIAAPVIANDLDGFEQQQKSRLASTIVSKNSFIRDYVQSHPLASTISNDDYGNLDLVSDSVSALHQIHQALSPVKDGGEDPLEGFKAGGRIGQWAYDPNAPFTSAVVGGLAAPVEVGLRGIMGTFTAATQAIKDVATKVGGESFGRDIGAMAEAEFSGLSGRGHLPEIANKFNQQGVDRLAQAVQEAQTSTTRERAPELFQDFVARHTEGSTIGVSGQRVLELYGDKEPKPDDGLLGWVPDIDRQLQVIRDTGADLTVPTADWVTKVDPALAKELHDDLRVIRGGVTNRELAEAVPPIETIAEPLPMARREAGAEPLFSIGDRKLTLQRLNPATEGEQAVIDYTRSVGLDWSQLSENQRNIYREEVGSGASKFTPETGFHDFDLVNENGQSVGTINLSEQQGGKQLYIEMINGLGEYYNPNNFGPSLIRDLVRQLKAEFPNAETLTGHRVTGARDAVGSISGPNAMPKIKLSEPMFGQEDAIYKVLGGMWAKPHPQVRAKIIPGDLYLQHENEIADAISSELGRIAPGVRHATVGALDINRSEVRGAYLPGEDPFILTSLAFPDQIGTARHEAIHFLRDKGFFTPEEWSALEQAAYKEGWMDKFQIHQRYDDLDYSGKLEESIADAYPQWKAEYEARKAQPDFEPTIIDKVFSKLSDLIEAIKGHLRRILGHEPTFDEIFKRVDEGEVGAREGTGSKTPGVLASRPPQVEGTGLNTYSPFETAKDVGMTVEQYRRYQKLIEERQQADIAASTKRVLAEQTKRQTDAWKKQAAELRPQVVADLNARPDIAADNFFGRGELQGTKLDKTYRLDWEKLTPEQREAIPERYVVKRGGISPDEAATLFGYSTGNEMIEGLARISAMRKELKMGREAFDRHLVQTELNRRMEAEHGFLEHTIYEEALDQIHSQNQLDLLHEETHALALMLGEKGFDLNREQLIPELREKFDAMPVGAVSSEKFLREAGKHGQRAEMELLRKNPAEAFKAKQVQYYNMLYSKMASAMEKDRARLDKTAKPYQKGKTRAVDPAYVDHIQQLLMQAGYKVRRDPEELAHSMEFHGQSTLGDFVDEVSGQGWDPQVEKWLQVNGAKPIDSMTTKEFGEFKDAIDSLNHIGREVKSIEIAGEKQDFAEFKERVLENLRQLPARSRESQGRWLYRFDASLVRMEELIKDFDLRQELGPMFDAVIRPMMLSKSKEFDLMTGLSKHFQEVRKGLTVEWRKSLQDSLPNDLIHDPYTNAMYDMTRENLVNVMLNWGNRSNIDKLVQGFGFARWGRRLTKEEAQVYESQLKAYIDQHARKEDWDFVQHMWKPFDDWAPQMDTVARNTTGIAPAWIPKSAVETPHGVYEGGYWPMQYDQLGSGIDVLKDRANAPNGVFDKQYFRAATSKGYLKQRTGYVDFVNISNSIEGAVRTMQQTIHDIAFRDALMQASKVFYDKDIRNAIKKHYGTEYADQLVPWLKRISYQYPLNDPAVGAINDFMRRVRVNLVGHVLPFNLKVILSPDIGVPNPAAWARFEANRAENTQLAMAHSEEIRHLVYNLDRDYREAVDKLTLKPGLDDFRKKAVQWGYHTVSSVSQEFRMATFVDEFNKQRAAGRSDHEAAVLADSRVREQHGAASIVDLPSVMASNEGMKMLTMFYGYFNTMYNWQRQLPSQVRGGEWGKAATTALGSIGVGAFFGATLFNQRKESDSWGKIIAKALLEQPMMTVPILNMATNYLFEGFEPRLPVGSLLTSAAAIYNDAKKWKEGKPITKPITHGANVVGMTTGLPLAQIGRTTQFATDVIQSKQRPKNIADWARGIISGDMKLKK